MLIFSIYMLLQGLALLVLPNLLLGLFGIPETQEAWIRLIGIALVILAYYYYQCVKHRITVFYSFTVPTRVFQFIAIAIIAGLEMISPIVVGFALVEMGFGLWTFWELKKEGFYS
jgi:hypothetical protein